ncbi:MAG TPA: phenylalanine--tRNA ligase subunit beta, partial [Chloroflexota bacterium]|nr:phenylalanine--tRNA ligase subunit beta [Chloroflexota bacterium]
MRVPLKWLQRYVELDRDAEDLARLLNASGTEVARIERTGAEWDKLRVAEILKIEKHPNADRLNLATVNTGSETMTVVCGAPNIAVGQKVPFAPVGAVLQGTVLEARPIRGITSEGMLCAADELGLSPDHSGILVLEPSEVPGTPIEHVLGDDVLELEVTPNRSDCLGIVGVAREIAALTRKPLRLPEIELEESGEPIERQFKLRIDDPELCPRFVARLITDVTIAQSPWWLQSLLHAAGVRAINNVVDVTNFIMLEWGKPIHAYDYEYVRGHEIIVRRAHEGEKLTTLDGVERVLTPDMLVIADAEGPDGMAGIMGGAESEVRDTTRTVLLESADFNAINMRRTARKLGMHSEAVRRFERGVDPNITAVAADHCCYWFAKLAGGRVAPGRLDLDYHDHTPRRIDFDVSETGRLLGKQYSAAHVTDVLTRLGFEVDSPDGQLRVTVPSWRLDVSQSADLVEELARITGYDDLPVTMPEGAIPQAPAQPIEWTQRMALEDELRHVLKGAGFSETVTYSLVSEKANEQVVVNMEELFEPPSLLTSLFIEPLKLANAMTEEQEYLRTSMLPSLLQVYGFNRRHTAQGLKLYEMGRVYWQQLNDLPDERRVLALLASGPWLPPSWLGNGHEAGFEHMHAVVELVLSSCGIEASFAPAEHPSLHPGKAAEVRIGEELIGYFGELHPLVHKRLDLPAGAVLVAELDLDMLSRHRQATRRYKPIRRFPSVGRQLTVALDPAVSAEEVRQAILAAGGDLLVELHLA